MSAEFGQRAVFEEAIGQINAGDTAAAEAICREALARDRRDVNMRGLLGAILIKMRRYPEAETELRETIRHAPTFAKPHEDLGLVLFEQGRLEESEACLRTAIRLDPSMESAHFTLGKVLAAAGKGQEADGAFERSFELSPERKALAHAVRYHKAGRLEEAERIYRRILRNNPHSVDALRLLGIMAARAKRPHEAERMLRRAITLAPDFAGAIIDLGQLLKEQDRHGEAIEAFERAIEIEPGNAKAHYLLGGTLARAALTARAIEAHERAIDIHPGHAGAWLGLAHGLKTVGRQQEAIEAYRKCIELKPDYGEVYWSLANLKTYRFEEAELQHMHARLEGGDLEESSEVNFLFALAKAYEDRGAFERAWHYYDSGNRKRRMQERYDPVHTEILNDAIVEVFDRELLAANEGSGLPDPAPLFIVGLPRSGSTLIEQILASHSQVEGTSELPYLGRVATSLNRNRADGVNYPRAVRELQAEHLQALGQEYIDLCRMHRVEGRPRFIDKMPNNFPTIGFAHLVLPNASIIDARRHPLDACLGCYRQLFARGQAFTYDLSDIGEYYLQYRRMMDHWKQALPGRVLTVHYEQVVADFDNQVRRILEHCGLPWEEGCVRFYETERPVRTASSEQVRQPIYTEAVGRWRHYEAYLGELIEILQPVLDTYPEV